MIEYQHLIAVWQKAEDKYRPMVKWQCDARIKPTLAKIQDFAFQYLLWVDSNRHFLMGYPIEFIDPSEWHYDFPLVLVLARGKIAVDNDGAIYELEF